MSYADFKEYMTKYNKELAQKGIPDDKSNWIYKAHQFVTMSGISDGNRPYSNVTRAEVWGMLRLFYEMIIKTVGGKK